MAIYQYRCKSCQDEFEMMRPMSKIDAPAPCPSCEGVETMRLLSLFAAQTRGGERQTNPASCATSATMGIPCCGGGCRIPTD